MHATFLHVLPRRIVQYRVLRRMTQAQLAKAAGVSRSTLNAAESGLATDMKVSSLERICHALGVSADALLGYNSIDLVRRPELRGTPDSAEGDRALALERDCPVCNKFIRARILHLAADCMMELSDHGATVERIGAVFGLSSTAVELVLREQHEIRRHSAV